MFSPGQNLFDFVERELPFDGVFEQNALGSLCLFGRHVRCTQRLLAKAKASQSRK